MLGLDMAGFENILANEVHPDPCKTLEHNFKGTPIICDSIKKHDAKSLLKQAEQSEKLLGRIDLVAGGPPCQGFSTAGMKNANDPRNTLIWDFIRVVKGFQPEFFIMENVTGLATLHDGKIFDAVMNEYVNLRYSISHAIIYAADFGVPQMRKRLIIMGSRTGRAPIIPDPTHREPGAQDLFSAGKPLYITCGDAIGDLPPIQSGETASKYSRIPKTVFQKLMRKGATSLHNHQASKHSEETAAYYGLIPPGGTPLDIPAHLRNKKQGIQRWPLNGLSRTITTEPTDFLHPTLNRTPTVRETARIQTFPDRYVFLGQRTTGNKMRRLGYCSQTQQVGNAVPPLLAKALGESIAKLIT